LARIALKTALGSLAIGAITLICFSAHADFAIPMPLYLLVVVVLSLWGGFASAAIVSVAAVASLDYFFIPPVLEWQINDPKDTVALVTYLATSLVITRLASKAQREARTSERGRRDVTLLYDAASQLLSLDPEMAVGPESLRMFCQVFSLRAACLFDAGSAKVQVVGESVNGLARKTREAYILGEHHQDRARDLYIRYLHTGDKITGAVGFEGRIDDDAIALAVSALAATALERMRLFRSTNKAAADAQAEMLRSAIVDALAHQFKTPLAIILAASDGLREIGSPQREQVEMIDIIENQTVNLSQLSTRLLRMARLDRDDVKPQMEPASLNALVQCLIDQCRSQTGRLISLKLATGDTEIMADPELLSLAMTQLLDNACKYSNPGSTIGVELGVENGHVDMRVSNAGSPIPAQEQERIFERFFRGSKTEHVTPGTGLGLYVAQKIVRAHGGFLELYRSQQAERATTFRIRLPIIQHERVQELEAHQSVDSGR
jgi:two-component system, OmpR family, sensor histidine kinase KdpD